MIRGEFGSLFWRAGTSSFHRENSRKVERFRSVVDSKVKGYGAKKRALRAPLDG